MSSGKKGREMKNIFMLMYPIVGIISVSAFVPQIISLLKAISPPVNVSIKSWLLWSIGAFISLGYGFFFLEDVMFTVTAITNFTLNLFVLSLLIHRRFVVFGHCRSFSHALMEYFLKYPFLAVKTQDIATKE
jgi:uncharacterized protein with PQ loop repeat